MKSKNVLIKSTAASSWWLRALSLLSAALFFAGCANCDIQTSDQGAKSPPELLTFYAVPFR